MGLAAGSTGTQWERASPVARLATPRCRLLGEQYGYNLNAWRRAMERRDEKTYKEGFAVLDADGGWDLLCQLIQ